MPVKPFKAKKRIAYIFVMTHLKKDDLEPLIWDNAEARADVIYDCFKNDLEYDDVKIFTDLSKEKVLEKLEELQNIASKFSET